MSEILLLREPTKTICTTPVQVKDRWIAGFSPINFQWRYYDRFFHWCLNFSGYTGINCPGHLAVAGQYIYIFHSGIPEGLYTVLSISGNFIVINLVYSSAYLFTSGHYTNVSEFENVYLQIKIYSGSALISTHDIYPDYTGVFNFDPGTIAKTLLSSDSEYTGIAVNESDSYLSASFSLTYQLFWTILNTEYYSVLSSELEYYVVRAAHQVMDANDECIVDEFLYMDSSQTNYSNADFLTEFIEPECVDGQDFDIAFLYSDECSSDLEKVEEVYDVNGNVLETRIVALSNAMHSSVNRMKLSQTYPAGTAYIKVWIQTQSAPGAYCFDEYCSSDYCTVI